MPSTNQVHGKVGKLLLLPLNPKFLLKIMAWHSLIITATMCLELIIAENLIMTYLCGMSIFSFYSKRLGHIFNYLQHGKFKK